MLLKKFGANPKFCANTVAEDLISKANNRLPFMKDTVTSGKTLVCEFEMETSQQSSELLINNELKP